MDNCPVFIIMPQNIERRPANAGYITNLTGFIPTPDELSSAVLNLSPNKAIRERLITQAVELEFISEDADKIFKLLKEKALKKPSGYSIFTAGFSPPEGSIKLGEFGQAEFENFLPPEILGHTGEAYAVPIDDNGNCFLAFTGRAHPTEWISEKYNQMLLSHPLRVVKEMIRRQRVDEGMDPPIILTYLAGAIEGYNIEPGDLGLILTDSERTNVTAPGFGPISLLDSYLGSHFQEKYSLQSDKQLSQFLYQLLLENGLRLFPVVACGAPGTPEFENPEEIEDWENIFRRTREKASGRYSEEIFGPNGRKIMAPVFDMGVTFELAVIRQHHPNEKPFRKIALALISDNVGESGSGEVSHEGNVGKAIQEGAKYRDMIVEFLKGLARSKHLLTSDQQDFSLHTLAPIPRNEYQNYHL